MFEKIGRLAEAAANEVSVSRRGFFGRLGQAALAVGAVLGGFSTAAPGSSSGVVCCYYNCQNGYQYKHGAMPRRKTLCKPSGTSCDSQVGQCYLFGVATAAACKDCQF
jgi:hypothetical protein